MIRTTIVLVCFSAAIAACTTNPVTGRKQLALVSEEQVAAASSQAYAQQIGQYRAQGKLETNSGVAARVRTIAGQVIREATKMYPESAKWQWEVNVVDEPQVNAYAMAGGKVVVYTGIMDKLNLSDHELAQVIGHEIAHALAGHTREKVSVQMGTDLLIGATTQSAGPVAQQALGAAAMVAVQLPNSRNMESEADRVGMELAARAGYHPEAAISLWKKMAQQKEGGGPPEFLSTHPSDQKRLEVLAALAPKMMPYYVASAK